MNRKLALCIITGEKFFGHEVLEKGKVMFVNLDEDQDKQVRLYYRMTKGKKIPGYLISRAKSCRLPDQIGLLEADIKLARPILVNIDPMQRIMGGKKVNEQSDVGPIIDELKRLSKEYDCTISVNHHANKSSERDRETTSSWLSGSNDLDAAWDFCHCLEYNREKECVHFRNFQKEKAKSDIYYEAEIVNGDEIIDLHEIPEELSSSKKARDIYRTITFNQNSTLPDLLKKLDMPGRTFYNYIERLPLLKNAYGKMTQIHTDKGLASATHV